MHTDEQEPLTHACAVNCLPMWSGPWKWVVYTVDTSEDALALRARGVDMLETDRIRTLLRDPRLGGAQA
jgi:hypothetical protein